MSWLKRKLFGKKISITIIGAGNAGCRVGDLIVQKFKENDINVRSLAINQVDNFTPQIDNFSDKYWFGRKESSSNGEINEVAKILESKNHELKDKIEKVVFYKSSDTRREGEDHKALHLIIGSGGGTGAAVSMLAGKMIKDITGDSPTIVFIAPEKDESSLIQYNAAKALHFLGFDFKGPYSPILLFDNEKLLKKFEDESLSEALKQSNNLLAETLTTTILFSLQESNHEEYNADLNDFFAAFGKEATGIGIIIAMDKEYDEIEKVQNLRFSDLFFSELDENSSLTADVTRAKRGYLTITTPLSAQTTFETRKIEKRFEKGSIKISLTTVEEPILSIRGVLTGIHPDYVDRFWEILEAGRDSRKSILDQEETIRKSYLELKID